MLTALPRFVLCCLVAIPLAGSVGCGSSTYEAKFKSALEVANKASVFSELGKNPLPLADSAASIRLPQALGGTILKEGSRSPDDAKLLVHPNRLRPPFLQSLPGYVCTIEKKLKGPDSIPIPMSCSIWAIDTSANFKEKGSLEKAIADLVKTGIAGAAPAWQEVDCPTPKGATLKWKRLEAAGTQPILLKIPSESEQPVVKQKQTHFDFWLHDEGSHAVLLVWRVPEEVKDQFNLENLAPLAAGTLNKPAA